MEEEKHTEVVEKTIDSPILMWIFVSIIIKFTTV